MQQGDEEGAPVVVVIGSVNVDLVIGVPALPRRGERVLAGGYALKPGGKGANKAVGARRSGAGAAVRVALALKKQLVDRGLLEVAQAMLEQVQRAATEGCFPRRSCLADWYLSQGFALGG